MSSDKTGTLVIISLYICSMIFLGIYFVFQKRNQPKNSITDGTLVTEHFLGGRNFGTILLTFTMFATVFSGYTVVGIPNEAYKTGFQAYRWVAAIFVIVWMFAVLYPRLRKLSLYYNFSSPTDMITQRYGSKRLTFVCIFCQSLSTLLYLIAQFRSIYTTVVSLIDSKLWNFFVTVIIGLLIFIIESLGGLKIVSFTDVIQSCLLISGFIMVPFLLLVEYGTLSKNMNELNNRTDSQDFLYAPTLKENVGNWTWVMAMVSFPLYPHLLQRLYAAKSNRSLKRMWTAMTFAPWMTVTPGIMIGVYAKAKDNDIKGSVFGKMIDEMLAFGWFPYFIASMVLTSSLAAIMSTADSALISISNIITLDIFKKHIKPDATETQQLFASKIVSFLCVVISVSCSPFKMDLSVLLEIQGGILMQILPAFLFGLYSNSIGATSLFYGSFVGIIISVISPLLILEKAVEKEDMLFLSGGLWGFLFNIIIIVCIEWIAKPDDKATLSLVDLSVLMKDVTEPVKHKFGRFLTPICLILTVLTNPFFFESGRVSTLYNGVPGWTIWTLVLYALWSSILLYACNLWDDPNEGQLARRPTSEAIRMNTIVQREGE